LYLISKFCNTIVAI